MKDEEFVKRLTSALLRLKSSETRITRRNARKEMFSFLQKLKNAVEKEYPPIDKRGKDRPRQKTWACPICNIALRSTQSLGEHVARNHFVVKSPVLRSDIDNMKPGTTLDQRTSIICMCWCGMRVQSIDKFKVYRKIGRHLMKDGKQHVLEHLLTG